MRRAMNHILGVSMRVPDFATGPWIDGPLGECEGSGGKRVPEGSAWLQESTSEAGPFWEDPR